MCAFHFFLTFIVSIEHFMDGSSGEDLGISTCSYQLAQVDQRVQLAQVAIFEDPKLGSETAMRFEYQSTQPGLTAFGRWLLSFSKRKEYDASNL